MLMTGHVPRADVDARRLRSIGMADSLIAGIVMARGGTLCTRSDRHFSRIHGLKRAAPADV